MKIYLVGGAVRDRLLNLPIKDRDWLVVGSTPDEMKAKGFQQVGRDFPVFLHPQTGEEYALARTERKTGQGHRGFAFTYDQHVTAEEDLSRRDLTINAIAEDENGQLLDPFDGEKDIKNRILRHVSPAFSEDPLRVLRLMRFWARFADLGFTVAPQTLALCQAMVASGELATLTPERVWQECERALKTNNPSKFFQGLEQVGGLSTLGFSLPEKLLEEMNARLALAVQRTAEPEQRLAFWLADTSCSRYREALDKKLPLPKSYQYWLKLVAEQGKNALCWRELSPLERWSALKASQSLRQGGYITALITLMGGDKTLISTVEAAQQRVMKVSARDFPNQKGAALGEAIKNAQIAALA